ncbi:protoporphyrinogen oxidase [Nocardioides sp. JQ2195]|uniref:protoporphyrinogen oxidase n=1 Tax=Nocardioides sp. JQ2195 TaxID=2592334 RepID=UPI00143ED9B3|nr:protoporphyrinogen oxidase [Nocardioides sp. JQ2195]QIX27882.1 protoporphyrinogen oxidase [Nocardioides sp. JQ2195]
MTHVVVVGAGIAGLTAAHRLARAGRQVTVLEGSPEIGGKLRLAEVGGVQVDVGAEAMLNRRPEATGLARELGFELVHPGTLSSRLWTRDALRVLPRSVMGIPADLEQLQQTGVLSDEGLARAREERVRDVESEDVSVADLIASRLGDEVVDRLVEPLLGGVYAGHATELSARATIPQVVALLERSPSLLEAARQVPAPSDVPVFAGMVGGIGRLPQRLAVQGGFEVRTSAVVRELRRVSTGSTTDGAGSTTASPTVVEERGTSVSKPRNVDGHFELVVGPTAAPELIRADEVVLALPATPASRLLADLAPLASHELREIEYASMAIVTMVFRAADLAQLQGSGFLVPPVDGRRIKAATFSFNKWDWVREAGRGEGLLTLRTSIGRHREEASLQFSDDELVVQSLADLALATGVRARPVDTHVQRWGGALPQYAVGHLDRVRRIRASVGQVPGLAVCGAAYDGIGIPAVVSSAERAVAELISATQR